MLSNSERYPLQTIIINDLFSSNKLDGVLLLATVITAVGTIWITHQTRMLTAEKGDLVFAKQALENEYLNLKLEETAQSDKTRIELFATQLGMKQVDSSQEVVILE